jgi:hypothetical protein
MALEDTYHYTPEILKKLDDTHESISQEDVDDLRNLPSGLESLKSSDDTEAESTQPQATSDVG